MAEAKPIKLLEDVQPGLFGPGELPDIPKLVESCKRYVHTGRTTCRDEERAASIAQAYLECGQILTVARRFHISPNTVHAVLEVLERAGKLDDIKQRVSRTLGLLAEVSAERAIEMVAAGLCPANVLPINLGVAWDKKALIDGDATSRVEASVVAPVGVADVLAYLAKQGVQPPAIDLESIDPTPKPKQIT